LAGSIPLSGCCPDFPVICLTSLLHYAIRDIWVRWRNWSDELNERSNTEFSSGTQDAAGKLGQYVGCTSGGEARAQFQLLSGTNKFVPFPIKLACFRTKLAASLIEAVPFSISHRKDVMNERGNTEFSSGTQDGAGKVGRCVRCTSGAEARTQFQLLSGTNKFVPFPINLACFRTKLMASLIEVVPFSISHGQGQK
jgi:hypothetical protein